MFSYLSPCRHGADPSTCFSCRGRNFTEFKQTQAGNLAPVEIPLIIDYTLITRLDLSGHKDGKTDPHENTELLDKNRKVIKKDLSNNQLPGLNGYQKKKT